MLAKRKTVSPLRLLGHIGEEFDEVSKWFDDFSHFYGFPTVRGIDGPLFSPSIEFTDKQENYILTVEIPGVKQNEVTLELTEDSTLVIKGEKKQEEKKEDDQTYIRERYYGAFRREIRLPADANPDDINASYESGILTINILKKQVEEKSKSKKIEIKTQ